MVKAPKRLLVDVRARVFSSHTMHQLSRPIALVQVLERQIREVLIPRDLTTKPKITVNLRGGLMELEDVMFNQAYLASHTGLPFAVRDSLIKRVRIIFSMRQLLLRQQIEIRLEGVSVVLVRTAARGLLFINACT